MRISRWRAAWLVVPLLLVLAAWHFLRPSSSGILKAGERPDIVLITIETTRADHLRSYGYLRLTMPVLEHLATEGIVFEKATAAVSWTLPSVATIFTGLPPGAHGVRTYEDQVSMQVETLAERLRRAGYHTAFFGVNSLFEADRKIDQGFEHFYGTDEIAGEELNEHVVGWLRSRPKDRPTFLYVHYFDPHCRYVPPNEYRELYWPPEDRLRTRRQMTVEQWRNMHECFQLHFNPGEPVLDVDYYLAEYDAELRHVDHLLGLLLERLKTHGLYDSSLLVITSDHGEEFYDHGGFGHGKVLFEHQTHVPLIMRLPRGEGGGRRVADRVSHVDLYPTLLATAGLKAPSGLSGIDLNPIALGTGVPARAVFAETDYEGKQRAVWEGKWKLIVSPDRSRPSGLYDLEADRLEQTDLSASQPEVRKRLLELLRRHEEETLDLEKRYGGTKQAPTEDTIRQLKALGYTAG